MTGLHSIVVEVSFLSIHLQILYPCLSTELLKYLQPGWIKKTEAWIIHAVPFILAMATLFSVEDSYTRILGNLPQPESLDKL